MYLACLLMFIYPAYSDARYREFYIEPVIAVSVLLAVVRVVMETGNLADIRIGCFLEMMTGCLPGMVFLGISMLTKGAVGVGDVVVIGCLGILSDWQTVSLVCLSALVLTGLAGLLLLIAGRVNRKTALPFVPFLMAAFLILWFFKII